MTGSPQRRGNGALNAALANELGKLIADFTGRGAQRSRAFIDQDVVVCILEDGATMAERNLVAAGKAELVRFQRDALQMAMAPQLIEAVQRLTERTVRTFMSGMDEHGNSQVEVFILEPEPEPEPEPEREPETIDPAAEAQ
ncbi:MAG: Na-translocating system protein MpsC family protein [Solirubrobacteraceae bacterium]